MPDVERLVVDYLLSFNQQLPVARRMAANLDAAVIGADATFDSLDAVEFLMGLEDAVAAVAGQRLDLCRSVERIEQDVITLAAVAACVKRLLATTLVD